MKKPSKYRNTPTFVDGRRFASKAEAHRFGQLSLLQRARQIQELECQPRFRLEVGGAHVCDYVADFTYIRFVDTETGWERVVEDVKGAMTKDCAIKLKLMKALKGIDVKIIKARPSRGFGLRAVAA